MFAAATTAARTRDALWGTRIAAGYAMELPFSEYDVWTFKKDTNGRWIWLRQAPDGEALSTSHRDYDELDDCVADAKRGGYKGSFPAR